MNEFELIKKYFSIIAKKSKASLNLNDDVFFDKLNKLVVSVDTYIEGNHFINFKKPDLNAPRYREKVLSILNVYS